jgi:hypothetical protein
LGAKRPLPSASSATSSAPSCRFSRGIFPR